MLSEYSNILCLSLMVRGSLPKRSLPILGFASARLYKPRPDVIAPSSLLYPAAHGINQLSFVLRTT